MRRLVADVLRREGFVVEEIADGKQLLLRVVEAFLPRRAVAEFDLVVSDVRMPFCSGLDVLKKLRTAHHATPVLLMTAFGEPALRSQVQLLNALLLDKPFTPTALKTAVRELLASR
jgi:DNA-binding response OmpR family regulator